MEDNTDKFAEEFITVDNLDEELIDIEVQIVTVHEKPNNNLNFANVVSAEIKVSKSIPP